MGVLEWVIGGCLIAMAAFLVVAVLMQSGQEKKLSGTIAGGADTFFSKNKGNSKEKWLPIATTVVAIIFVALVLVMYLLVA